METLQADVACGRCLGAEGILGTIKMGMEVQRTTRPFKSVPALSPENYIISERMIRLRRKGEKKKITQRWPEVCNNFCNEEELKNIVSQLGNDLDGCDQRCRKQ